MLVVVAKTQAEENVYGNFLFVEKTGESFWNNVIDCLSPLVLTTASGVFPSITLGPTDPLSADAVQGQPKRTRTLKFGLSKVRSDYLTGSLQEMSQLIPIGQGQAGSLEGDGSKSHILKSHALPFLPEAEYESFRSTIEEDGDYSGFSQLSSGSYANADADSSGAVSGFDDFAIVFELNDVNSGACMANLVRVILRMAVLFNEKWSKSTEMPKWLSEISSRIVDFSISSDPAIHRRNMRLFFMRLLMNQPIASIVKPWSGRLLSPMVECCLHDLASFDPATISASRAISRGSESERIGFNYFLRDVVFLFVDTWADCEVDFSAVRLCSRLLCYLISVVFHNNSDLMKENTNCLCSLIALWVKKGQVSFAAMDSMLMPALSPMLTAVAQPTGGALSSATSAGSEGVRMRITGLKLLIALAEVKLPFLSAGALNASGVDIMSAIVDSLKYPRQEVMETAALAAGHVLALIAAGRSSGNALLPECLSFEESVERVIAETIGRKGGLDDAAAMICAISRNYACFLSREMLIGLLASFKRFSQKAKGFFLEFLVRSTKVYDSSVDILEYLKDSIPALLVDQFTVAEGRGARMIKIPIIQYHTVRLLSKYCDSIRKSWYDFILGNSPFEGITMLINVRSVGAETGLAASLIRAEAYRFLIKICEKIRAKVDNSIDQLSDAFNKRVLMMLLRGLADPDDEGMNNQSESSLSAVGAPSASAGAGREGIRKFVYDYFKSWFNPQNGPEIRLISLMTDYFDIRNTDQWLHYASYLLLDMCCAGAGGRGLMFERGLCNDGDFQDAQVVLA